MSIEPGVLGDGSRGREGLHHLCCPLSLLHTHHSAEAQAARVNGEPSWWTKEDRVLVITQVLFRCQRVALESLCAHTTAPSSGVNELLCCASALGGQRVHEGSKQVSTGHPTALCSPSCPTAAIQPLGFPQHL